MNTTQHAAVARDAVAGSSPTAPPRPRVACLILARIEGRHLIRRPVFVFGALLSLAAFALLTWSKVPVLHRDDAFIGLSSFPLACATFLAANIAVTRPRRTGSNEFFSAAPMLPETRTSAHLLCLAWPVMIATLIAVAEVASMKVSGGVWSPSAQEVATGPVLVAMFGAAGILTGRLAGSTVAGSVGLVALLALEVYLMTLDTTRVRLRWAAFWVDSARLGWPARELIFRPAGWHALCLVGLTGVVAAAARLRHGLRAGRAGVVILAVTIAVAGAWGQYRREGLERLLPVERVAATERVTCESDAGVEYCAYEPYAPLIERWRHVVRGVYANVPSSARRGGLLVRQALLHPDDQTKGDDQQRPGLIQTKPDWGRRNQRGHAELAVATRTAAWAVGLHAGKMYERLWTDTDIRDYLAQHPQTPPADVPKSGDVLYAGPCSVRGQARSIVALWLAASSTADASAALRSIVRSQPYGLLTVRDSSGGAVSMGHSGGAIYFADWPWVYGEAPDWGGLEAAYAVQLLDKPDDEVARKVMAHWAKLMRASTTTEEAAPILGLKRLPTLEEQLQASGAPRGDEPGVGRGYSTPAVSCP